MLGAKSISTPLQGNLSDNIVDKLKSWKGKLLSLIGRVQLVKYDIKGSLLYSFQVYTWPAALPCFLKSRIRNF